LLPLFVGRQHGDKVDRRLAEEFQAAFWAAKRAMADAGEAAFQRHGVRSGQQWILRCLWAEDGLTPGEVARRLDLSTPTVTKAATRMEAAGLLVRRPHQSDARLVRLHLTDRGRSLEKVIAEEMDGLGRRALATLEPAESEALVRYLTEIRRNLS
jgi:MarR family transcriptional regulator, organic hydroperoxide resistance regulator